jgi:hypothetical protein
VSPSSVVVELVELLTELAAGDFSADPLRKLAADFIADSFRRPIVAPILAGPQANTRRAVLFVQKKI